MKQPSRRSSAPKSAGGQRYMRGFDKDSDPYLARGKSAGTAKCPDCGAVCFRGRWSWRAAPSTAKDHRCPACQRVHDKVPAAYLTLRGEFVRQHEDEVMGLVHNTERFVISILRSAASNGLDVANYIEAKRFLIRDRRVFGIEAVDRLNGDHFEIRGRCTLNATGPWARHMVRQLTGKPPEETPPLLKAIDLIVGRTLFDGYAVGLQSRPKGEGSSAKDRNRLYFFVPWRGTTMIGTYYTQHRGAPDSAAVEEREIEEFLDGIQAVLPKGSISAKDIRCLHFGLLPMDPASDRRGVPSPASTPWFCDHARSDGMEGLVSVQGVKYTTARAVAERTVDYISNKLGVTGNPCRTGATPIFGGDGSSCGMSGIFPETVLRHLAQNYGSESSRILGYATERPELGRTIAGSEEVLRAELVHGIREEMAQSLGDLVFRRTDLGTIGHPGRECLDECAKLAAAELGWDDSRILRELESVERSYPGGALLPTRRIDFVGEMDVRN